MQNSYAYGCKRRKARQMDFVLKLRHVLRCRPQISQAKYRKAIERTKLDGCHNRSDRIKRKFAMARTPRASPEAKSCDINLLKRSSCALHPKRSGEPELGDPRAKEGKTRQRLSHVAFTGSQTVSGVTRATSRTPSTAFLISLALP